jgi:outer membrane lipoprotein carrier protein
MSIKNFEKSDFMKKIIFVFASFILILLMTAMQDAKIDNQKARTILDGAGKKMMSFSTMKINFIFTEVEDGKEGIARKGRLWTKGDKYQLRFAGQEVFSDGESKWTYIRDAEEVHITSVIDGDDDLANPRALLNDYERKFTVRWIREENHKGKKVDLIDLYPKERKGYHRVRLRIEKNSQNLSGTTVFYTNKTMHNLDIDRFVTNEAISDAHFTWDSSKHPNVEVIDLR